MPTPLLFAAGPGGDVVEGLEGLDVEAGEGPGEGPGWAAPGLVAPAPPAFGGAGLDAPAPVGWADASRTPTPDRERAHEKPAMKMGTRMLTKDLHPMTIDI